MTNIVTGSPFTIIVYWSMVMSTLVDCESVQMLGITQRLKELGFSQHSTSVTAATNNVIAETRLVSEASQSS